MHSDAFNIVSEQLSTLQQDITTEAYAGYPGDSPTDGWGGAGIGFSTVPIELGSPGFYPAPRIIVTPHAHAVGWLLDRLGKEFFTAHLIDSCTKIEFYGRLAMAAQRYQAAMNGKAETAKGMLQALLGEARQILAEMQQGTFKSLMVATGNEIAADHSGYGTEENINRYFAYGSNMDEQQMNDRCPGAVLVGKAQLAGYRFIINSRGVATIVSAPEHTVYGLVWQINRGHEASLDDSEGVRFGTYTKQCMPVLNDDGTTEHVLVYVASDDETGKSARQGYLEKILRALCSHAMPNEYIDEISSIQRNAG
jgi:gamma-glutamylcyclotransferase (GGCT)/AIG2-like uncharacterized protein YtfP